MNKKMDSMGQGWENRIKDVPDTTLPDTGFNRIAIFRIPDIPDSSKFKRKS